MAQQLALPPLGSLTGPAPRHHSPSGTASSSEPARRKKKSRDDYQKANHLAVELGEEGRGLGLEIARCVEKLGKTTTLSAYVNASSEGVIAFDAFLKWKDSASNALGRSVEVGLVKALEPEFLAEAMRMGAELRYQFARRQFKAIEVDNRDSSERTRDSKGYRAPRPEAVSKPKQSSTLTSARAELQECWTALGELCTARELGGKSDKRFAPDRMAFDVALLANQSKYWHLETGFGRLQSAIDAHDPRSPDGLKLRLALVFVITSGEKASNALQRINKHSGNSAGSIDFSCDWLAKMPNLEDEIEPLRSDSSAASMAMAQIADILERSSKSHVASALDSSQAEEPMELVRNMADSFEMFSTALASWAQVLGDTLPKREATDEQARRSLQVESQFRSKKPDSESDSSSSSAPKMDSEALPPQSPNLAEFPGTTQPGSKLVDSTKPPTPTTQSDASSATTQVKALIKKLKDARKNLEQYDYSRIKSLLDVAFLDVPRALKRLERLIKAADPILAAQLSHQRDQLNKEVQISYGENVKLDAYKRFGRPQANHWHELWKNEQIRRVWPAERLEDDLFEIRLDPKRCSDGFRPESVVVHVHLYDPAKPITPDNVKAAHVKRYDQRNLGPKWEANWRRQGFFYEVHRSNIKPESDFFNKVRPLLEHCSSPKATA